MSSPYLVIAVVGIIGFFAVKLVLRHAARLGFVQNANARSSHAGQRPTGGGLGIVVAAAFGGVWIAVSSDVTPIAHSGVIRPPIPI